MISIDFKHCEVLLRNLYQINNDEKIYIIKLDVEQEKMRIEKILHYLYRKLSNEKLERLNLSICKNTTIALYYSPVVLKENLDTLNSKSGYFNDICYPFTSESNTDILLKDRKKEFIDKNKTVCQEDCDFSKYNNNDKKVECICKVKEFSFALSELKINKTELLNNFKGIKKIVNIDIIVCYKNLLNIKGLLKKVGNYILIFIIIFHIVSIIVFF